MTVFVIQQPSLNSRGWMPDLSSAASYGNIEYIFLGGEKVYALPGPSLFKARKVLREFDPDKDFVLWPGMGDPMAYAVAMIALSELGLDHIKFLYWDRTRDSDGGRTGHKGFYVPIPIHIKEKRNEQDGTRN